MLTDSDYRTLVADLGYFHGLQDADLFGRKTCETPPVETLQEAAVYMLAYNRGFQDYMTGA